MCVFDPAALRHRLDDEADWWSVPREEVLEMNQGNVGFFGLGSDGKYVVKMDAILATERSVACHLKCPSGRIFVGAGEEVTGQGLEPECVRGGMFIERVPGYYRIAVARRGSYEIALHITESLTAVNKFDSPVSID